jgi:hypothetical protein
MPQPQTHIDRTRAAITRLCNVFEDVISCTSEYTMLGGEPGVKSYWMNPDGSPITGRDISHDQYIAAINVVLALQGMVNTGQNDAPPPAAALYAIKG